jgi:hypothetical protein
MSLLPLPPCSCLSFVCSLVDAGFNEVIQKPVERNAVRDLLTRQSFLPGSGEASGGN